jgi:hypothetical protein
VKTTVYLNQPTEERFKKIKASNPDYSLSEAVELGLKVEEERISTQLTGMEEQIAKKGTDDRGDFYGTKAKFVGRKLAQEQVGQVGDETYVWQTIYLTKKGKYLLQEATVDERDGETVYGYEVCNTIKELQEKASAVVLSKAGRTEGEFLPDLDI